MSNLEDSIGNVLSRVIKEAENLSNSPELKEFVGSVVSYGKKVTESMNQTNPANQNRKQQHHKYVNPEHPKENLQECDVCHDEKHHIVENVSYEHKKHMQQKKENLRNAMILSEVLSEPMCKRRRHNKSAVRTYRG